MDSEINRENSFLNLRVLPKKYETLNAVAFRLLKQYVPSLKSNFVFNFGKLADSHQLHNFAE